MQTKLTSDLNVIGNSGLEITLLDGDLNIIQKLDDEPNDVGGLTSAELKAKFDEAGNTIKKYINETLIPEILVEDATEEAREAAETARQNAETTRGNAETARATAETARAEAEVTRQTQEASRQSAERNRTTAEAARAEAEADRAASETLRVSAEAERENAETARQNAESGRSTAEGIRNRNEADRQAQETARQSAEAVRTSAETTRAAAESARVTAEDARCVWVDYNTGTAYIPGNKVLYLGSSYVNIAACTGVLPTNTAYWQLIASKGADGQGAGDMKTEEYDPTGAISLAGGIAAYASKRAPTPTAGHLAELDADGNVTDSGKSVADFTNATHAARHKTGGADPLTPVDIGAAPAGVTVFFSESQWAGSTAPYTLAITASVHKRAGADFLFDVWALSDGTYYKNIWAVQELDTEYAASSGTFSLISEIKFAGKIVFAG